MSTASETVDAASEEAAPRPSLVLRLKRLLAGPLLWLRHLRRRKQTEVEEDVPPARARDRREESEEAEEIPAGPPLWRRALPYVLVLLAGAAAGGGAVYWLSAQIIAHQSIHLAEQDEEVTRLKGVLAGYDRMMLQSKKKLDEEQGKRAEVENRLSMAQTDLAQRQASAAAAPGARPEKGGSASAPGKTGECTLHPGTIGSTLKGCLEEFNR